MKKHKKTYMTVEEKALIWARKQKGDVLDNHNIDCFIAGYNTAAKEYKKIIEKGYKKVLTELPNKLKKQLEINEAEIWYSGYMHSLPYWFIKKKLAYNALCDAIKQCKEFMDDIKSLL